MVYRRCSTPFISDFSGNPNSATDTLRIALVGNTTAVTIINIAYLFYMSTVFCNFFYLFFTISMNVVLQNAFSKYTRLVTNACLIASKYVFGIN